MRALRSSRCSPTCGGIARRAVLVPAILPRVGCHPKPPTTRSLLCARAIVGDKDEEPASSTPEESVYESEKIAHPAASTSDSTPSQHAAAAAGFGKEAEAVSDLSASILGSDTCESTPASASASAVATAALASSVPFRMDPKLGLLIGACLVLGVFNRVAYKIALLPMKNYLFFLAQLQNFGYLLTYFTVLGLRYRSGKITDAMLAIDKRLLVWVGACEAIKQVLFMIGASHVPGALLPIVTQSYLLWNFAFNALILGTTFTAMQIGGVLLVLSGVLVAGAPPHLMDMVLSKGPSSAAELTQQIDPMYVAICVICFAFPAVASNLKERIFKSAQLQLGQPLDIFIVNSFGSLFQAIFVICLLPFMSSASGIAFQDLPAYLSRGAQCMVGLQPSCGSDCTGAPLLPLIYVVLNLGFNVVMLTLLRTVGTATAAIITSCLVPLTVSAFIYLPLPFLEPSAPSSTLFIGTAILTAGMALYNYANLTKGRPKAPPRHVDDHEKFSEEHIKSKYRGVSQYPSQTGWRAHILAPRGKVVHLGTFKTEEEAANAYDAAAKVTGRSTHKLNFPKVEHGPASEFLLMKLYGSTDPEVIAKVKESFVAKEKARLSHSSFDEDDLAANPYLNRNLGNAV